MNTYYQGSDGSIKVLGDNELMHYKYIKKIGNRYFYTPEALRAFYRDKKRLSEIEYVKDRGVVTIQRKKRDAELKEKYTGGVKKNSRFMQEQYRKEQEKNARRDAVQDVGIEAKRVGKPVVQTAKRAVTPIDPKKEAKKKIKKILKSPPKKKKSKPVYPRNYQKPYKPKPGTPASRW